MDTAAPELTDRLALDSSAYKIKDLSEQIRQELLQASEHDQSKSRVINMRKMAEKIVHDTGVTLIPYR